MSIKDDAVDSMTLIEARFAAQKIAFGPIIFQAARLLRDLGILEALRAAHAGLTLEEITAKVATLAYGVLVLLEAGLPADMVRAEGERFLLTKTGACVLRDDLTRINMDFVHHGCFQAMYYLEDSIRDAKPAGLAQRLPFSPSLSRSLRALPRRVSGQRALYRFTYRDVPSLRGKAGHVRLDLHAPVLE